MEALFFQATHLVSLADTEAPIRLIDVDGDGRLDIITAIAHEWGRTYMGHERDDMKQLCSEKSEWSHSLEAVETVVMYMSKLPLHNI